jgi:hypothetical protein
MSQADFTLTYDGPALQSHEMNVRDLAPAMLGVGEVFEALNSLYNGKATDIAVNVRAHEPGCFTVVFDVIQHIKSGTDFLAGTEVTAALNLREIVFGSLLPVGGGLIWLIRKLKGRTPDRIEKLSPGMFRLIIGDETYDIPVELLQAYKELSVRRALERFVTKPLQKPGIEELRVESGGRQIARVEKQEAEWFRAPVVADDVIIDDTRRAAFTIRDLSFDEDGLWRLNDGSNPIKAAIVDRDFLAQVEADEIRFAKHDVLVCMVHFVQKRKAGGGLVNEYTVTEVLEHIPAPRQLRLIEHNPQEDESDGDAPQGA